MVKRFHIDPLYLPIVLCPNGKVLRNPGERELARCVGLVRPIDGSKVYDVAIVGAGPAGLAAAVYAGSEGLSVIVLDCRAFGGQAGASARIENYLGFPTGISGLALMARAYNQAQKFGVEMVIPDEAKFLACDTAGKVEPYRMHVGENETVQARAVVIACGARYRRLEVANLADFEGTLSTIGLPQSRPSSAATKWWRWLAPAIRPDRRPSISPAMLARSGCSPAARFSALPCRATSSSGSPPSPTSWC